MKSLQQTIPCLVCLCIGFGLYGQQQQQGKLSGDIIFNGSKSEFTYFHSTLAGESLPYARTIDDVKESLGGWGPLPRIGLRP